MTKPSTNPVDRIRNAPLPERDCANFNCAHGGRFTPKFPNQRSCCDECRDAVAAEKAELRKAKSGHTSGRGEPAVTAKIVARETFIAEEVKNGSTRDRAEKLLAKTRPDLVMSKQYGQSHFTGTDENKGKVIAALAALNDAGEMPSLEAAAVLAGGRPSSVVSIESWMRVDPAFKRAVRAEQAGYLIQLDRAAHKLAVEGVDKAIVNKDGIIGTEKVYSEKVLLARLKQFSPDFHAKNQSGGGTNVSVTVNNGMVTAQDSDRPHAIIYLDETWRLTEQERDQLAAIYARVLQIRQNMESTPKLDWSVPDDVKAELDLSAEDITGDESYVDI